MPGDLQEVDLNPVDVVLFVRICVGASSVSMREQELYLHPKNAEMWIA